MITELCELGFKYGTDKSHLRHYYTEIYYILLKDKKETFKKVLEIGIDKGASLRMWRDFFPNATIYGIDVNPETIFEEERISTFCCNSLDESGMEKIIGEIGGDLDFVIDDGSHHCGDQIFLANKLMPMMKQDILYTIEDVRHSCMERIVSNLQKNYQVGCMYPNPQTHRDIALLVIRKKIAEKTTG